MTAPLLTRPNNAGFSLVELMVAISISLVLLVGLIQVFISSKRSYNIQDSIARMQENGRYAVELLNRDLRLAGYMGGNADVTTISGNSAPVVPDGNCVGSSDAQWGRMVARGLFGLNDALTGYDCINTAAGTPQPGQYLAGDIITVRYAKPAGLKSTDSVNYRGYYLKSSPMDGQIELVNSTSVAIDSFFGSLTDAPVSYNKLESYAYYIGFQQADCNGNATATPALYRLALDTNGTPERQEMIRGIENLQVQYGEDSDNDGSPNQYKNADDVADWAMIKSVRLWLLVRDECPSSGYTNQNTYLMGDFGEENTTPGFTPNDSFRRHLYTTTVMLRNNEAI